MDEKLMMDPAKKEIADVAPENNDEDAGEDWRRL